MKPIGYRCATLVFLLALLFPSAGAQEIPGFAIAITVTPVEGSEGLYRCQAIVTDYDGTVHFAPSVTFSPGHTATATSQAEEGDRAAELSVHLGDRQDKAEVELRFTQGEDTMLTVSTRVTF